MTRRGVLGRAMDRLASSTSEIEDAEMQGAARKAGCAPISTRRDREVVTMHGTLRSVTLRPRGGVPALEATLVDGSGEVMVVWLGRRRIVGVTPGRRLTVHGRLSCSKGRNTLFNPRYELSA